MANVVFYGSAAQPGVQPTCVHAGVNAIYSVYSASATISASQTIRMAKLPDGARILDIILNPFDQAAGSTTVVNVGTSAATTKYLLSVSANMATPTHINTTAGVGDIIDVSDDTAAAQPYKWLEINCTTGGSGTASAVISLVALYTMDVANAGQG